MWDEVSIPGRGNDGIFFLFATASKPVPGPTQLPVLQRVPEALTTGGGGGMAGL
jgi:hypothetical protein